MRNSESRGVGEVLKRSQSRPNAIYCTEGRSISAALRNTGNGSGQNGRHDLHLEPDHFPSWFSYEPANLWLSPQHETIWDRGRLFLGPDDIELQSSKHGASPIELFAAAVNSQSTITFTGLLAMPMKSRTADLYDGVSQHLLAIPL